LERRPSEERAEEKEGSAEETRRRSSAYQAAMEAVFAIPIAMGIGWWVDRQLGSEPVGFLIGLGLGFATFIIRLVRMRGLVEAEAAEAVRREQRKREGGD
jgi:F0F1-type ATP synthase assembly protein I